MKKPIQEELRSRMDKTWMYRSNNYKLLSFDIAEDDNLVTIVTDSKWFKLNAIEAVEFLDELLPVDNSPTRNTQSPALNKAFDNLAEILTENITKVQSDANYVSQAKVVNQSVSNLINLAGLQVKIRRMNGE